MGAVGVWVTAIIYVVILIYAAKQVGEARRLRRAQTRPFVIVDLEPGYLVYLVKRISEQRSLETFESHLSHH